MDPEKIMESLSIEIGSALKKMSRAKNLEEKKEYSIIIKNLCESLGVFFKAASDMIDMDMEDFDEF